MLQKRDTSCKIDLFIRKHGLDVNYMIAAAIMKKY